MDLDIFEFERSNILDKYFYKRDSHGLVTNNRCGLVFFGPANTTKIIHFKWN